MRTISTYLILFFLFSTEMVAQKNKDLHENQAIITVIKAESTAFYNNDYQGWKDQWSQSENSIVAWNSVDGTYKYMRGWKEIDEVFKEMIENQTEEAHPDFNIGDVDIEINGSFAFIVYDEYVANNEHKFSKVPGVKTLKKVNGEWKLHTVISFWDRNYQYSKDEVVKFTKDSPFVFDKTSFKNCGCFEKFDQNCKTDACREQRFINIGKCLEACPERTLPEFGKKRK